MDVEIDKELLRARLEAQGHDASLIDIDLAVAYEKAVIETALNVDIEGISAFGN